MLYMIMAIQAVNSRMHLKLGFLLVTLYNTSYWNAGYNKGEMSIYTYHAAFVDYIIIEKLVGSRSSVIKFNSYLHYH